MQHPDRVTLDVDTPDGNKTFEACYLLGCDGGRSTVRDRLGVTVEGRSLPERYSLVDLKVDLDVENPRDYPYLAYFSDAREWMILVRQPECWRFLYPVYEGQRVFDRRIAREGRAFHRRRLERRSLGTNVFKIYHRVARRGGTTGCCCSATPPI